MNNRRFNPSRQCKKKRQQSDDDSENPNQPGQHQPSNDHDRENPNQSGSFQQENELSQPENLEDPAQIQDDIFDHNVIVDKLPDDRKLLEKLLAKVNWRIVEYKQKYIREELQNKKKKSQVGDNSVPICANILNFNWKVLMRHQLINGGRKFDVILMDPPWKITTKNTQGRAATIQYQTLADQKIQQIPINRLQDRGFLFIWVINCKFAFAIKYLKRIGYQHVDTITWIKTTGNQKLAISPGFYLQHAKQTCLVAVKGNIHYEGGKQSDLILSQRRGQSQKPVLIYDRIQSLVPNGFYLEIFGRRNNLRDKWVTIGNQI